MGRPEAHLHEPVRVVHAGRRPEERRVGQAEDGGGGADPRGQGQHQHKREARPAPEHPPAEAKVLRELVQVSEKVRQLAGSSASWLRPSSVSR